MELIEVMAFMNEANKYKGNPKISYEKGYDCGLNGANTDNCHFGLFATKEMSNAWSEGNKDGIKAKTSKNAKT